MPIEIRELVIRTTLENPLNTVRDPQGDEQVRKAIVKECVTQVLERLQEQHTR